MTPEYVVQVGRYAIEMLLIVATPLLGVALVVGLVVSVLQAITQINENTLSFLPKLLALVMVLGLGGPWILARLTGFIREIFLSIPGAIG